MLLICATAICLATAKDKLFFENNNNNNKNNNKRNTNKNKNNKNPIYNIGKADIGVYLQNSYFSLTFTDNNYEVITYTYTYMVNMTTIHALFTFVSTIKTQICDRVVAHNY